MEKGLVLESPTRKKPEKRSSASSRIEQSTLETGERDVLADQIREVEEHLAIAKLKNKMERGEALLDEEREVIEEHVSSRGWYRLFEKVQEGDMMVTFLVPNDAHVSIKHLNDVVFGPQVTDALIARRQAILSDTLLSEGFDALSQSYKDAYFRIPKAAFDKKKTDQLLEKINNDINEEIRVLVAVQKARAESTGDMYALRSLNEFEAEMSAMPYRMTYGITRVERASAARDLSHIERAVSLSTKGAMSARKDGEGGREFTVEMGQEYADTVGKKRDEILSRVGGPWGSVVDITGRPFVVFEEIPLPDGTSRLQLNLSLIRDVRKGKFISAPESESVVNEIRSYMGMLNILDVVKPYTHEEFQGKVALHGTTERLSRKMQRTGQLLDSLSTHALGKREARDLAMVMAREGKDQSCTSAAEFHARALDIPDCTYISLDVLDVGPRLLQEFEILLTDVQTGRCTFEEASVRAGDQTTQQMRSFREKVTMVYQQVIGTNELPPMLVGGDEALLALPTSEKIEELLIALRRETQSRVVRTIVAKSEREAGAGSETDVVREHILARQRAEKGATIAKEMERTLNNLAFEMECMDPIQQADFQGQLDELAIANFVVLDPSDQAVILRANGDTIAYSYLKARIDSLQEDAALSIRAEAIKYHLRGYVGVNESNIRMLLKLKKITSPEYFQKELDRYRT